MSILPDKTALRAAFDAAVSEIATERPMLTNEFYAGIGTSVLETGYQALQDFGAAQGAKAEPQPRLHVVSAPSGSGKTSFSEALIVALVRLTQASGAPLACLFLTDQIERADKTYRELAELLPGQVAIWTTDHDATGRCRKAEEIKVRNPAARHTVGELERFPVVVTTHAFYQGSRGHKAREFVSDGQRQERALTLVDERPNETIVFDVLLSQAEQVREHIQADEENRDAIEPHISALVNFMRDRTQCSKNLEKPTDDPEAWSVSNDLGWFRTEEAERYAKNVQRHVNTVPFISQVFGYARSVAENYAFIGRSQGGKAGTRFVSYRPNLLLTHGMVLLDATADIDGIQQVCLWRVLSETPRARYDNLEIVHVPTFTRERLKSFFRFPRNRAAYVRWMREMIIEHMAPGQRGLIVCKKTLFDNEHVPKDPRVSVGDLGGTPTNDPIYSLTIEGRLVALTHWGHGIGSNDWKNADVVFLFDEFYKPRRVVISEVQALRNHKATEGDLATMKTQNSHAPAVDALSEGHLLRWSKQMCLRGRARCFDEHGICGKQKLVFSGKLQRLLNHRDTLFPGAKIVSAKANNGVKQNRAEALLTLLSDPKLPNEVSTNWVGQQFRKRWREIADVVKPEGVKVALETLGWRYVSQKGRRGSRFERIVQDDGSPYETEGDRWSAGEFESCVSAALKGNTKAENTAPVL